MAALTVAQALAHILAGVSPLPAQSVPLVQAAGRILAADLHARLTQPPFDASAMDGYAVRASDVASLPARLQVIGEAAAGRGFGGEISVGEAVRIFTGAPVPTGADAIVIQENTRAIAGNMIDVCDGQPDHAHIRPRGGDFTNGDRLLEAGRILDARALTLAAAGGHAALDVRRRPVVAIIATGDELVPPGQAPGPDQIVSSNPVGLAAMLQAFGAEPRVIGIARDTMDDLLAKLEAAADADIIVTTGGASVGDHDLVRPALAQLGVTLDFWKLAMRPGKPMLFGRRAGQSYLGLPGNPVSALITCRVFVVPLVAALLGRPATALAALTAPATVPLEANGPRQHYMRACLNASADGGLAVTPMPNQDSSLLTPMAAADCLLMRPANAPAVPAGTRVPVLRLDF